MSDLQLTGFRGGVRIEDETDPTKSIEYHIGSGPPGGQTLVDAAPIGSRYTDYTTGVEYTKRTPGPGAANWTEDLLSDVFTLRVAVTVGTGDAFPGDGVTVSAFSDDDGGAPAVNNTGFAVDDLLFFGTGGGTTLAKVTAVSPTDITVSSVGVRQPETGDVYIIRYYLPDPGAAQEDRAVVVFTGTELAKLGDANWDTASGIRIGGGYIAASGDVTAGDSVDSAIRKLDGVNDAQDSTLGVVQGATDLGALTANPGNVVADSQSVKASLESVIVEIDTYKKFTNVTAVQTIDSFLVDDYRSVRWDLYVYVDADETLAESMAVKAFHDGTAAADATIAIPQIFETAKLGSGVQGLDITFTLTGTGATQALNLNIEATAACTVIVYRTLQLRNAIN